MPRLWYATHNPNNRFEDPQGRYGVVYAGLSRLACFVETLADYRKAPARYIAGIEQTIDIAPERTAFGTISGSWLRTRAMGWAKVESKKYADIYSAEWLSHLRLEMEPQLIERELIRPSDQFDLSLLISKKREVSQMASAHIHSLGFDGIYYHSRHGRNLENCALFEPCGFLEIGASEMLSEDADFQSAMQILNLTCDEQA